ncbi:anthranilate synthase / indole-3-glycerol phosphate synthase [Coemansia sp. RSA 2611]|nr:anthranilate synthase / indole-3-glycerol phosphate synthase [Coemansia sp. RSA 2611]
MATILLDAYDSFTFNLYQYLSQAGADVHVFRNDKITLAEVIALDPVRIVLSPGPGHPREDPGICYEVLEHFAGKVPILGVCLGQQMMYEHYGGTVGYAGEIHHGKTSGVQHDAQGVYRGVAQGVAVTRYHSLAGDARTLPACLEINSWAGSVVMGVRHKELTVEGVQFHPESILSGQGHLMLENFVRLRGGTWAENAGARDPACAGVVAAAATAGAGDILERIFAQRQRDVAQDSARPGRALADLQRLLGLGLAPAPVDFAQRLRAAAAGGRVAVLAEIKRASPSKGDICAGAVAAEQGRAYAAAGAAAISVLTEPTWFKGTLDDLRDVRAAVDGAGRPAVLRKDFVFDEYQVAEARLAGADAVLLIVKMLERARLEALLAYSRALGMEPLVEVNTPDELRVALAVGARVVGVNNRDLRTFAVDMDTTRSLAADVPADVVLVALSGIVQPADAAVYAGSGVSAVLVGEALMRAPDMPGFVRGLQGAFGQQISE